MNTVATPAKTALRVPLLDLRAQYQTLKPQIMSVIGEVCDNQTFILGPYVKRLESEVAAYVQSRHGIGVSSGTDALLAALMALDVRPGDEVITSPYTFFATGGAVARRIGIVAMARRVLIALWRYATTGLVPEGAALKA